MSPSQAEKSSIEQQLDLLESKKIDIATIQTVCMALGPYRNLTTLTASILFLHPHCQVLNHAGNRIFNNEEIDFIANYNNEIFEAFTRYAIYISQKGTRGDYGGSITLSHAFDKQYSMKDIFNKANSGLLKQNITALFWKESLRTSNHIRRHNVDLSRLFKLNRYIRFLLPIRNPLDCAVSNLRTGKVNIFQNKDKHFGIEQILKSILEEILWFKILETRHPDRFFYFFEHDFNYATINKMAEFLQIEAYEDWCTNAIKAFDVRSKYRHSNSLVSFFHQCVENQFSNYPEFAEKLLGSGKHRSAGQA